jgi:hypothetical protein
MNFSRRKFLSSSTKSALAITVLRSVVPANILAQAATVQPLFARLDEFIARHMRETLGVPCDEIRGYFQLKGGLNGGTAATVLNGIQGDALTAMGDRFLLDPPGSHSRRQIERSRDTAGPRYDAEIGAWTGPFFMAPTNARVVRRSAALHAAWGAPYGPEFVYQEFLKYDPPHARAKAYASTAGIALICDYSGRTRPHRRCGSHGVACGTRARLAPGTVSRRSCRIRYRSGRARGYVSMDRQQRDSGHDIADFADRPRF